MFFMLMSIGAWLCFGSITNHLFDSDDLYYLRDAANNVGNLQGIFQAEDRLFPGRPVVNFIFGLVYLAFGENPVAHHTLSIALHLFASLILFYTLRLFNAYRIAASGNSTNYNPKSRSGRRKPTASNGASIGNSKSMTHA